MSGSLLGSSLDSDEHTVPGTHPGLDSAATVVEVESEMILAGATMLAALAGSGVELTGAQAIRMSPPVSVTSATPGAVTCISPGDPKATELTPAIMGWSVATTTPVLPWMVPVLVINALCSVRLC